MRRLTLPLVITLLAASGTPLRAQEGTPTPTEHKHTAAPVKKIDVPEAAAPAVAVVDAFSAALTKGDFKKVEAMLDPAVVILEAGGAEHSRAEYLGGHAKSDAKFLAGAHSMLRRRIARAEGRLVWVASELEVHTTRQGKAATLLSSETMLLRQSPEGWRIIHIHWSSRQKTP